MNIWQEVDVSSEGISISTYSECDDDVVLEDESWFTWSELDEKR